MKIDLIMHWYGYIDLVIGVISISRLVNRSDLGRSSSKIKLVTLSHFIKVAENIFN